MGYETRNHTVSVTNTRDITDCNKHTLSFVTDLGYTCIRVSKSGHISGNLCQGLTFHFVLHIYTAKGVCVASYF